MSTCLGMAYLQLGDSAAAFEHFGNALTIDPTDPKVLYKTMSVDGCVV